MNTAAGWMRQTLSLYHFEWAPNANRRIGRAWPARLIAGRGDGDAAASAGPVPKTGKNAGAYTLGKFKRRREFPPWRHEPGSEVAVATSSQRTASPGWSVCFVAEFVDILDGDTWTELGVEMERTRWERRPTIPRALFSVRLTGGGIRVTVSADLQPCWARGFHSPQVALAWGLAVGRADRGSKGGTETSRCLSDQYSQWWQTPRASQPDV